MQRTPAWLPWLKLRFTISKFITNRTSFQITNLSLAGIREILQKAADPTFPRGFVSPDDAGQNRTPVSLYEKCDRAAEVPHSFRDGSIARRVGGVLCYCPRYPESLNNVTLGDVYIGGENVIVEKLSKLKEPTLALRRN